MRCALSAVGASRNIDFRLRSFFAFFGERTQTILRGGNSDMLMDSRALRINVHPKVSKWLYCF